MLADDRGFCNPFGNHKMICPTALLIASVSIGKPCLALKDIQENEVRTGIGLLNGLTPSRPFYRIERQKDGWIKIQTDYESNEKDSSVMFRINPDAVLLKEGMLTNRVKETQPAKVNDMIMDSFRRVSSARYTSHGFAFWVRQHKTGWLVVWCKYPLRFHDNKTVSYTTEMVFEGMD